MVPQDTTPPRSRRQGRRTAEIVTISAALLVLLTTGTWLVAGLFGFGTTLTGPSSGGMPVRAASTTALQLGRSVRGNAIVAQRFGSGGRRYLVVGGVHGDEYGTRVAQALTDRLRSDPGLVPTGTEIDIIVAANPDGVAADTRGNANGIDLNRNFPSKNWASTLQAGDVSAVESLSGGPSAASEPETKAMVEYLKRGFSGVVSLHSSGGIVDYDGPGGLTVAARVSRSIGLPVQHLAYQAAVRGSMGIYVAETYGIPIITVELASPRLSKSTLEGILAAVR